jgi:CheY-like chemotaxis protein
MKNVLDSPIPFIVMSCLSEPTVDLNRLNVIHSHSYLKKPCTKDRLLETIYSTIENNISPQPMIPSYYHSKLQRFFPSRIKKFKNTVVPQFSYSNTTNQSKNMRAVIVDDDIVGLKILGKIISSLGYDTDLFVSGLDAYTFIEKSLLDSISYDLIITDIDMPGLDGILLIDVCRNILNLVDVPIIVISSDFRTTTHIEAKSIGADAFLVKPVHKEVILQTFATFKCNHQPGKILDHQIPSAAAEEEIS